MISIGENKASLCKGDFHPVALYKGDKKIAGYSVEEFSTEGNVTLKNCYNDKIYDVQIRSKNLLNVKKLYGTYANENGGITLRTGQLADFVYSQQKKLEGVFKENTQYTFSFKYNIPEAETFIMPQIWYTDGTRTYWYIGNGINGIDVGEGIGSFTSRAGGTVSRFDFSYGTNSKRFECELTDMQIEEGATATEYEQPLTEATITARGKNILDISNTKVVAGYYNDASGSLNTSNKNFTALYPFKVKPNTTYTITSNLTLYTVWFSTGGSLNANGAIRRVFKNTFTTTEDCNYIRPSFRGSFEGFEWCMLELGEGDGVYEPYIEPQTIPFENGELTAELPTFKGTTIIEVDTEIPATISGKYKKLEDEI